MASAVSDTLSDEGGGGGEAASALAYSLGTGSGGGYCDSRAMAPARVLTMTTAQ